MGNAEVRIILSLCFFIGNGFPMEALSGPCNIVLVALVANPKPAIREIPDYIREVNGKLGNLLHPAEVQVVVHRDDDAYLDSAEPYGSTIHITNTRTEDSEHEPGRAVVYHEYGHLLFILNLKKRIKHKNWSALLKVAPQVEYLRWKRLRDLRRTGGKNYGRYTNKIDQVPRDQKSSSSSQAVRWSGFFGAGFFC